MLEKGGHPHPQLASAKDEAAEGMQACNPGSLRPTGLFSCLVTVPQKFAHGHTLGTDQTGCSGTHMNT